MKNPNCTSRTILDAATLLFSEQGYDGTSVAEIAKLAGVASGTVIYQYKSKENLLQVIAWEFCNNLLQQLRQAGRPQEGRSTLINYVRTFFEYVDNHRAESMVILRYYMVFQRDLQRFPLAADGLRALSVCIQDLRQTLAVIAEHCHAPSDLVDQLLDGMAAKLLGASWLLVFTGKELEALEQEMLSSMLLRIDSLAEQMAQPETAS